MTDPNSKLVDSLTKGLREASMQCEISHYRRVERDDDIVEFRFTVGVKDHYVMLLVKQP